MEKLGFKGIQCKEPGCRIIFRNKTRLHYHQEKEHPGSIYNVDCTSKCTVCRKVFKTKQLMQDHFRRVHSCKGRKAKDCQHCGKTFKNQDSLRNHIFRVHKQKKLKCDKCKKQFVKQLNLVNHKCRQYSCKWCSKVYSSSSCLSRHVKLHHMYCCIFCPLTTDTIQYNYDKLIEHCLYVHKK